MDQLVITSIQVASSNVLVHFTSRLGEFYRLEYTDSFSPAVWKTAVSVIPGTGDIVTAIDIGGAGHPSRFYRIAILSASDLIPIADFSASPVFGQAPLQVTFTDTSTGYITNRFWDFGDGSTTNTTGNTVSHTYASRGTNTVTLIVSGPSGNSTRTRPNYIGAVDYLLITSIRAAGSNVLVSFTSKSGNYYRLEYTDNLISPVWKTAVGFVLGTGDIVTGIHQGGFALQSARFYRVHLLTDLDVIPSADFLASTTNGPAPLQVNFTDNSAGYITNRFWDFGDGSTTNTDLTTVPHTYVSPGTNTVTLTVTGPFGNSSESRTNYIIVTRQIVLAGIRLSGTDVVVSFTSEAGQSYGLEYTDNLNSPIWNTAVASIPGTGGIVSPVHFGGGNALTRFYRVRLL